MKKDWPNNKQFAFTIVDDTDNATIDNVKPIYDYLYKNGFKTTKTVWPYPSRNSFSGGSLSDEKYLLFVKELIDREFKIALHNVGSGKFNRNEILEGLSMFKDKLGFNPKMHINHSSNVDNIYWGEERYQKLVKTIVKLLYKDKRKFEGTNPESEYFWGDVCKENIKYIRNHTFNGINTIKYDPQMPYIDKSKEKYSNYWFSSSDGHTVEEFNNLITKENIDKLERENGVCIIYTHFAAGFVDVNGDVNQDFIDKMNYISSKDGWFVPASELLDYMLENKTRDDYASNRYLNKLDIRWLMDRVIKKIKYRR